VTDRLQIRFAPSEGAIVRMLGLVERRGYAVSALAMSGGEEERLLVVDLEPRDPGRHAQVVARQLERLVDVKFVSIVNPPQGTPE
jgi:acetolactate synthase-1/3 small subunit/acetolactate synthase II small subunit